MALDHKRVPLLLVVALRSLLEQRQRYRFQILCPLPDLAQVVSDLELDQSCCEELTQERARAAVLATAVGIARLRLDQGDLSGARQILDDAAQKTHELFFDACVSAGHSEEQVVMLLGARERSSQGHSSELDVRRELVEERATPSVDDLSDVPWGDYTYLVADPEVPRPACWVVDIDGTLALHQGRRSPYDLEEVEQDDPNWPVIELVQQFSDNGFDIVIVSGRQDSCLAATQRWLYLYNIPHNALYLRTAGDSRKDSIVKFEIFSEKIAPYWSVYGVLDDRDQVVEMWRDIGLLCLQVAEGNF